MVEKFFRPLVLRMVEVLEEGIASGELIAVDPAQIQNAALGANVLYFLSAPLMHMVLGKDLLTLEALELRRTAAIEFLGQAIFVDREHGARAAARTLAEMPMPKNGGIRPQPVPELRAKQD
jgi:TetR/AcrR family transcriptional regulator